MAPKGGRPQPSLTEALRASPERYDFVQVVRILERAAALARRDPRYEPAEPIGFDGDPKNEALTLRAALELQFPAAEVVALDETDGKPQVSVTLMGLNGPSGVLPSHYSQHVLETVRDKNPALRDFLDLFNHRALSFFSRASGKYRLLDAFEAAGGNGTDPISSGLLALVGMREPSLQNRQPVSEQTLIFYAGHFAHRPRTATALAQILSDYFDQQVRVVQFLGRWVELKAEEQSRPGGPIGKYQQLGVDTVVGARMYDVQGSFRLVLGPLDYAQFKLFLPDGAAMKELAALTRSYVGPTLSYDVRLTLKASEIPAAQVGAPNNQSKLGWNTWLPVKGARDNADDAVFRVETC